MEIPMPKSARKPAKKRVPKSKPVRKAERHASQAATAGTKTRDGVTTASSKQARVLAMLRSPAGATIDAIMTETGWRQHSVRGFLAGVVRKRLGLRLQSSKVDGLRVYRTDGDSSGVVEGDQQPKTPKRRRAA